MLRFLMECLHQLLQQVHLALTMKVSETANVVETSQRNINITFFNKLSRIFPKMRIDTIDALNAAGKK